VPFVAAARGSRGARRGSSQAAGGRDARRRRCSHRNAEPIPKEPAMTTPRTQRLAAFTLSLFTTFVIFSGVVSLSSPEHAGLLLAASETPAQTAKG
jgi:hypothetical protein